MVGMVARVIYPAFASSPNGDIAISQSSALFVLAPPSDRRLVRQNIRLSAPSAQKPPKARHGASHTNNDPQILSGHECDYPNNHTNNCAR